MNQGIIQQIDTPHNVYHHPANTFVASFIGSPAMNIMHAIYKNGVVTIGENSIAVPQKMQELIGKRFKLLVGIRPEEMQPNFQEGLINGNVEFMENTGNLKTISLRLSNGDLIFLQSSYAKQPLENICGVDFDWENVCLFDAESGQNLEKV